MHSSHSYISATMTRPEILLLSFLLIATISVVAMAVPDCVYTIRIQTGTRENAGTDSVIGVTLSDNSGHYIDIKNVQRWGGIMGSDYNYNENGHLDIYTAKDKCLPSPVCLLTLTSDGSGGKPGWYVDYVEVTTANVGSVSKVQNFSVQQWLAIDESPYELTTERNNCGGDQ